MRGSVIGAMAALGCLVIVPAAGATFPGQNGNIAYVQPANGEPTGFIGSYPGGGQPAGNSDYNADPAWSPDGQTIAFARDLSFGDQSFELFTPGCCGDEDFGLADGREPTWSPDGQKIAFTSSGGTVSSMNFDGTGQVVLANAGHNNYPAWSPDGTKIAFTSDRDGSNKTYVMNADGSDESLLADPSVTGIQPNWSPNGQKVAFAGSFGGGDDEIGVMEADGTDVVALTSNTVADRKPVWSPDGTKIAFEHGSFGVQVWTMNPDGSGQSLLFTGTDPDWQPKPVNGYARPKGATPIHASLVPAYNGCTAPNRTHGPPLSFESCGAPQQTSSQLTVGTPDANAQAAKSTGYVRYDVLVGNPATPADEADVHLEASIGDVRNAGTLSDYAGNVSVEVGLRSTDKDNTPHPGGPGAATVSDISFSFALPCASTVDTTVGSTCSVITTADAVTPGMVKERLRSNWEFGRVEVRDGNGGLFMTQGVFIP